MKVPQNDEMNLNAQPVRPPRVPSIVNLLLKCEAEEVIQNRPCSDNIPLLLKCEAEEVIQNRPRQKRYVVMWERDASLPEKVESAWS